MEEKMLMLWKPGIGEREGETERRRARAQHLAEYLAIELITCWTHDEYNIP